MAALERRAQRDLRRGGRRGAARVNRALLVGLGLSVLALLWQGGYLSDLLHVSAPRNVIRTGGRVVVVPDARAGAQRLLAPVPLTTTGSFAFQYTDGDGAPLGYDPCVPIRYVVRGEGAPDVSDQLVADAVATIQAATGLSFESLGATDEALVDDREPIQARYGDRWAPVLFAWSDGAASPVLAGEVVGVGGSSVVPAARGDREFLAAGRVLLDAPDITAILARPGGYAVARAVVVHELAHVVGLAHVDDANELMAPQSGRLTQLGPGDLHALATVGQIACDGS